MRARPRSGTRHFISVLAMGALLGGCGSKAGEACDGDCAPVDLAVPSGKDAGSQDAGALDGGGGGDAFVPEDDVIETQLDMAELPRAVEALATVKLVDADATGATTLEVVSGEVSPTSVRRPTETRPGREITLVIRWGYMPPIPAPMGVGWVESSGYLAVAEGEIELLRALRWDDAGDPKTPRPATSFVAPQTDPRVLRFRSFVGAGSEGIFVRVRRFPIKPVVLVLQVGGARRAIPMDDHLVQHLIAGGWAVPAGNLQIESDVPPTALRCYAETGTLAGTWSYGLDETLDKFVGSVVRKGGAMEALTFMPLDKPVGPFGNFKGTLGGAGATVEGFYARTYGLGSYDDHGEVVARVNAKDGSVQELLSGAYDANNIYARTFRRVACDDPAVTSKNYFRY